MTSTSGAVRRIRRGARYWAVLCFLSLPPCLPGGGIGAGEPAEAFIPADGFLKKDGARVWNGEKAGQALLWGKAPDGVPAWQLTWNRERKHYAEIGLNRPVELAEVSDVGVRIAYYSDGREELNGLGVRLRDAKGETFQYDVPARDHAKGWKTLDFILRPDNFDSAWGGDDDKQLDLPASFIGFGVGFTAGSVGPVWIGRVELRTSAPAVSGVLSTTRLWSFDAEKERWWVGGQGKSITPGEGLSVPGGAKHRLRLDECMNVNRFYENVRRLRFHGELRKGDAATVTVVFRDAKNRETTSAPLKFSAGDTTAEGAVPAMAGPVRIKEAYAEFGDGGGELVLSRAEIVSEKPPLAAIDVSLETGSPLSVLTPDTRGGLAFRWENTGGRALEAAAHIAFSDCLGQGFSRGMKLALAPGASERHALALPEDLKFGIWYVDFTFSAPGGETARARRSFAYMVPAGPTPEKPSFDNPADFLYGICNAPDRWSLYAAKMDALGAALVGAKVFRAAYPWSYTHRSGPDNRDYAGFDQLVDIFAAQGVELQALFAGCPRWAVDPDAPDRPDARAGAGGRMPQLDAFRAYVREVGQRYQGKIRLWEVGNEPDHPGFARYGPEEQAKLQTAAFEELRRVDPEIRVMTGGFAGISGDSGRYVKRSLAASQGKFDVFAIHEHGPFGAFRRNIDDSLLPMRKELGIANIPWYANETALHSLGHNEKLQAESLFTKLIFARARGAIGFTWYNMRDVGFNPLDAEHHYGLLTADFRPKAVFPAYAALVNAYRGFAFERQLELSLGEYGFVFRNGDTLALAGWRGLDASGGGGVYALDTDAERAEWIDLMGNVRPAAVEAGRVFWNLDETPETLKLHGATRVEAKSILSGDIEGCAIPGREVSLRLRMENPLSSPLAATATLRPPAQFTAAAARAELRLAPGASTEKVFTLRCGRGVSGTFGSRYRIGVDLDFGKNGTTRFSLPVHSAACLSPDPDKKAPDFTLKERRQIRVLYDNQPNRPYWTGPEDLGAEITLAREKEALRIQVNVRDDIHLQRRDAENCWRDDSVQFALQFPGQEGGWEIGGAHTDKGPLKHIWISPEGADRARALAAATLETARNGTETRYTFRLPLAAFGTKASQLEQGFRFNLAVNDADVPEVGREGWAEIAPGIADGNKDVGRYPFVVFTK